jgi:hypothetical protein
MKDIVKIISNGLKAAYRSSPPDILPDIAAHTIIYELESNDKLIDPFDVKRLQKTIANCIEAVISDPHSVMADAGVSKQICKLVNEQGLLK